MKALLLDGSNQNDLTAVRVRESVMSRLEDQGWQVELVLLREKKIGNCAGDFFCWIRTPGVCNVDDDNREIAAEIVNSDMLVFLTPVTFGGYSSTLKRMVDHQIQNISPFFSQVAGETHHQKRYQKYPDFLAIGWMDKKDTQSEMIFSRLARRNALNFYARRSGAGVLYAEQTDSQMAASVQHLLESLRAPSAPEMNKQASTAMAKMSDNVGLFTPIRPGKALLLVGSPRTRKSSSQALGGHIFDRLKTHSVEVETIYLHTILRSPEKIQAMLAAVQSADLVLLAFPLYVDSLPAPVIEALEIIANDRNRRGPATVERPQMFAALANCGFPEATHNETALAICNLFALQTGFTWAGALALGAGEGLVHGVPLQEAGGPVVAIRKALELAAEDLAAGYPISAAAAKMLAGSFIPGWLYRLIGGLGWQQQARRFNASRQLKKRPYGV